jgi:hypothetical protein
MRLKKWSGTKPGIIIFVGYESMSGIGYICEIYSWGYVKRYVDSQHRRNGYFENIDNDVISRINDKIFYI